MEFNYASTTQELVVEIDSEQSEEDISKKTFVGQHGSVQVKCRATFDLL